MIGILFCLLVTFICVYYAMFQRRRSKEFISGVARKSVFITGCDSGFGRLLAIQLDKLGVKVYAGCLLQESMESLKAECSSNLMPVLIDVANAESVQNAAQMVKKDLKEFGLWGLVNNAGITGHMGSIEFLSKESFRQVLDINLLGTIDVTLAFIPLIKKSREGRIVNMSSAFGRVAFSSGGYIASKFAIEAFSDGLSFDLEPYGITIHTLNPGYYNTAITTPTHVRNTYQGMWDNASSEVRNQYGDDYVERMLKFKLKSLKSSSSNLNEVVDAYTHALFSKYPRNRYIVGRGARFLYIPISYLPSLWQLQIIKFMMKMKGNPPVRPIVQ